MWSNVYMDRSLSYLERGEDEEKYNYDGGVDDDFVAFDEAGEKDSYDLTK